MERDIERERICLFSSWWTILCFRGNFQRYLPLNTFIHVKPLHMPAGVENVKAQESKQGKRQLNVVELSTFSCDMRMVHYILALVNYFLFLDSAFISRNGETSQKWGWLGIKYLCNEGMRW